MEMESAEKKNKPSSSTNHPQQKDINPDNNNKCSKESIIRRTTVAYGIAELLKRSNGCPNEEIRIDNFIVSVSKQTQASSSRQSWDDIEGVGMISSGLSLTIEEPFYLSCLLEGKEESDGRILGRCLEVELTSTLEEKLRTPTAAEEALNNVGHQAGMDMNILAANEESNRCHLFARVLYELFTHEPFAADSLSDYSTSDDSTASAATKEPAKKKAKSNGVSPPKKLLLLRERAELPFQMPSIVRMQELGIPASICLMTQNLLESALEGDIGQSNDAYESFGGVCEDLHLLLLDPDRFLFDNEAHNTDSGMQLLYRKDKIYGRDKEETLITDAFCRVSRGRSEAFFIGGFSGSGKSMLVNSLRDRVDVVGGYVIKHKFDAMSQEKPLSGVISAFNQICQMIKDRRSPQSQDKIGKKLRDVFGVDFSLLMRLLPSVSVLFPDLVSTAIEVEACETMNARSVCFTLLRFVRVISSPHHPIMLFLDDLQWADSAALDVIHTILSDTMGSCMFFVGTYRNNEVQVDHDLFDLMEKLEISNVQTTKVLLTGLDRQDLNTMISDAMCLYPRICKPLSAIVFEKTKGNPFFVLEFMKSLKDRGLLQYNRHQKRWVWNEDITRGEEITYNVLHLLSSKMNRLSCNAQTLLKVMACFGSSTNESVIGYLSESAELSGFRDWLEIAIGDGFIEKDGGGNFKFVHDKVREAAYNLIPDSAKKQFHFNLGKALYSICEGKDVGDTIFLIASQINHGKEYIQKDKDLSIAVAKLNMKAGKKAIEGCDHKTAYSYLDAAVSFLPEDNWESYYDLSLSLNFLLASAANSCCLYDEAELILGRILEKSRCLDDQLPSYLLMSRILQTQGKLSDVYDTCSAILTELGESIPESYNIAMASRMIDETLNAYEEVDGDKWLKRGETGDKTLRTTLQFYNAIAVASYFCKSYSIVIYFTCRTVQLTLQKGICEHTPLCLLYFAGSVITDENAVLCYRIAKNAMSLLERVDVPAQIPEIYVQFYGRIAWRFEPLQAGISYLRHGFEAGLSHGNNDMAMHCALHVIKNLLFSGANLKSLLKEIDYYLHILETYKSKVARNYLLNFRETVSLLIDNGQATDIEAKSCFGDLDDPGNKMRETFFFQKTLRCYWFGHTQRCQYYIEKCMNLVWTSGQPGAYIAKLYFGLNSIDLLKKKKHPKRSKAVVRDALVTLTNAAANSGWNFTNKLRLLEAEQQAWTQEQDLREVIPSYDAAIASAENSGFIHEQGLACEKAGLYCKSEKNNQKALEYFIQARKCYEEWGSSMKVDFIQKELDDLC